MTTAEQVLAATLKCFLDNLSAVEAASPETWDEQRFDYDLRFIRKLEKVREGGLTPDDAYRLVFLGRKIDAILTDIGADRSIN